MSAQEIFTSTVAPFSIQGHAQIDAMAFSPDGKQFISAGYTGTVKFYNTDTGEFLRDLVIFDTRAMVREVSFSPDGKRLLLFACHFGRPAEVHVWDVESGKPLHCFVVPL